MFTDTGSSNSDHITNNGIGHIGGDEFAILMPETTLDQAVVFAERLRQRVSKSPYVVETTAVIIHVSVGIAEAMLSMASVDALMKVADTALYRAKAAGRNCVKTAEPAPDAVHRSAAE